MTNFFQSIKYMEMTKEEKELLIKDLCGRLPYGVTIHTWYEKSIDIKYTGVDIYTNTVVLDVIDDDGDAKVYVDNVKPYLRPLSSMTDEEYLTIYDMCWPKDLEFKSSYGSYWGDFKTKKYIPDFMYNSNQLDYLTSHHFDYRGLIEKGLALEAPEGMYKFSDSTIGNE